ncbi:phage-like element PBSX protein XkdK [Bacillus sp. J14TS2]|uniref:phage tail sheath family protein n=1 Tax=Bacillus sp. J14TS2 TaxID=2807188 RepID=UPI001B292C90|nr:phage tail sheath family protein [Bacillus sp. J14TS2]GIN71131.1 phage-like element PBSX protein XkdK [Bacillus sp. J14TS2]
MNGGTFTPGVAKERPGIYFRFTEALTGNISAGERGRVAIPVVLDWGESHKVFEISNDQEARDKLGLGLNEMFLVKEAKKRSQTVLAYRVNTGEKATATLTGLEEEGEPIEQAEIGKTFIVASDEKIPGNGIIQARYGGVKGNQIMIAVTENVLDDSLKDVITYLNNNEVDRQTVEVWEELDNNDYVVFSEEGTLALTAGLHLTGGENGTATGDDYSKFFTAIESEYFDVVGLPVDDDEAKVSLVSFVKKLREDQGVKVVGVVADYVANYEGIINVTNALVLPDRELTKAETVAWVAGASAGAALRQSLTFVQHDEAIDVIPRYDNPETINRLKKGEFMFTYDGRDKTVSVEQDINSLQAINSKFRKNKIIRILDAINNDITRGIKELLQTRKNLGEDIPANEDGEQLVRSIVVQYLSGQQDEQVLMNFDPETDVQIAITSPGDGFNIGVAVQPVDSAEKYYFDVEVQ